MKARHVPIIALLLLVPAPLAFAMPVSLNHALLHAGKPCANSPDAFDSQRDVVAVPGGSPRLVLAGDPSGKSPIRTFGGSLRLDVVHADQTRATVMMSMDRCVSPAWGPVDLTGLFKPGPVQSVRATFTGVPNGEGFIFGTSPVYLVSVQGSAVFVAS